MPCEETPQGSQQVVSQIYYVFILPSHGCLKMAQSCNEGRAPQAIFTLGLTISLASSAGKFPPRPDISSRSSIYSVYSLYLIFYSLFLFPLGLETWPTIMHHNITKNYPRICICVQAHCLGMFESITSTPGASSLVTLCQRFWVDFLLSRCEKEWRSEWAMEELAMKKHYVTAMC